MTDIKISKIIIILFLILFGAYVAVLGIDFIQTVTLSGVEGFDPETGDFLEHTKRWETFWTSINIWLQEVWSTTILLVKVSFYLTIPGVFAYWVETRN